jgi:hypothetical protein
MFNKEERLEKLSLAECKSDTYYRPWVTTFPGIGSFALKRNGRGRSKNVTRIIFFQLTIVKRHLIKSKKLTKWWVEKPDWSWKLVFIVPEERARLVTLQPFKPALPKGMKIKQVLLEDWDGESLPNYAVQNVKLIHVYII